MLELTSTRSNPMVDPGLQVWGWEIPVYLFFGGLVAGMMVISGYFLFTERHRNTRRACPPGGRPTPPVMMPLISLVVLSFGMFALFLDLEHKPYFWRLYTTFQVASPMSWGSWILLLVYPALAANLLLGLQPQGWLLPRWRRLSGRLRGRPGAVRGIAVANMVLGVALGIYRVHKRAADQ